MHICVCLFVEVSVANGKNVKACLSLWVQFNWLHDFRCVIQSSGLFCYTWWRTGIAAVFLSPLGCRLAARVALSSGCFRSSVPWHPSWSRANHRLKTFSFTNEDAHHGWWGRRKKNPARQHEPISLIWGPSRTQRASLDGWLARLADHWFVIDAVWSLSISHSYVIHQHSCASPTHLAHMPLNHSI